MAKSPVKKTAAKKTTKSAVKKAVKTVKSKSSTFKKAAVKKPVTDKEREFREANLIANLENKKNRLADVRKKPHQLNKPQHF